MEDRNYNMESTTPPPQSTLHNTIVPTITSPTIYILPSLPQTTSELTSSAQTTPRTMTPTTHPLTTVAVITSPPTHDFFSTASPAIFSDSVASKLPYLSTTPSRIQDSSNAIHDDTWFSRIQDKGCLKDNLPKSTYNKNKILHTDLLVMKSIIII